MIEIILYLVRAIGNGKRVLLYVFERKKKVKLCRVKYKTSLWWFCCSLYWTHDLTLITKTSEALSQGSPKPITDQVWRAYTRKWKTKARLQHMSLPNTGHTLASEKFRLHRVNHLTSETETETFFQVLKLQPSITFTSIDGHIQVGHAAALTRLAPSHVSRDGGTKPSGAVRSRDLKIDRKNIDRKNRYGCLRAHTYRKEHFAFCVYIYTQTCHIQYIF